VFNAQWTAHLNGPPLNRRRSAGKTWNLGFATIKKSNREQRCIPLTFFRHIIRLSQAGSGWLAPTPLVTCTVPCISRRRDGRRASHDVPCHLCFWAIATGFAACHGGVHAPNLSNSASRPSERGPSAGVKAMFPLEMIGHSGICAVGPLREPLESWESHISPGHRDKLKSDLTDR